MNNQWKRWKALWHPERYHGWGKKKSYFEGWYYKMVSPDESFAFALIPGISRDAAGKSHAFIQLIDGTKSKSYYEEFNIEDFETSANKFEVNVGDNQFSLERVTIDLPFMKGQIGISNVTPWPSEFGAPGVMGWYSFVPMMQCYHGVVSMHHVLEGDITYQGNKYDFDGGIGYIEKDWGSSFPKCWIWLHSNHFNDLSQNVCFMASVAHIPWIGRHFIGFLVALSIDGKLYKFTTYNGSKMTSSMDNDHVYLQFRKGDTLIDIKAKKAASAELISPVNGEMTGKLNESLQAIIDLTLSRGSTILYQGKGRHSGMEVGGDVTILLTEK